MAATGTRTARHSWPIVPYNRRTRAVREPGLRLAWALFLGLGLPFVLMTFLTILARAGVYIDILRPLWQPWPPDLLKPFLGVAVFAATLAYLAYRTGRRTGFRTGAGVRMVSARTRTGSPYAPGRLAAASPARPVPPPPPMDAFEDL